MSTQGLRAQTYARRPATDLWRAIFGADELPERSVIGVSGLPSSGKSTLALRLAEDNAHLKPLYCSGEEGLDSTLAARVERVGGSRSFFSDAANLPEVLEVLGDPDLCSWDLLVLDSVTSMGVTASDLTELIKHYAICVLAVCQSTKDGRFAGSQQLLHEAHAWIDLGDDHTFRVTKSWFGELNEGQIPMPGEE